jgi:3-oxoacyl-[acyl-carrier protein] reductase
MLLENETAIVYGAAGAIGSAVARAYAREGATVHLVGRTLSTLEAIAQRIHRDGGLADVTQLDVLDRAAVERHAGQSPTPTASTSASTPPPMMMSKARRSSTCPSRTS